MSSEPAGFPDFRPPERTFRGAPAPDGYSSRPPSPEQEPEPYRPARAALPAESYQAATPQGQYPAQTEPPRRRRFLGALSLALVAVAALITWGAMVPLADVFMDYVDATREFNSGALNERELVSISRRMQVWVQAVFGMAAVGFGGFIAGIVAAVRQQGAGLGATAAVLGLLAPLVAFVLFLTLIAPYMAL